MNETQKTEDFVNSEQNDRVKNSKESFENRSKFKRKPKKDRQDKAKKRLKRKALPIIFIQNSLNNTIMTLTDKRGNSLGWCSAGCLGFKNARKKNTFAGQMVASKLAKLCAQKKVKAVEVRMRGLGFGKKACVLALKKGGLLIKRITELTKVPFNGCRPPKKRRG